MSNRPSLAGLHWMDLEFVRMSSAAGTSLRSSHRLALMGVCEIEHSSQGFFHRLMNHTPNARNAKALVGDGLPRQTPARRKQYWWDGLPIRPTLLRRDASEESDARPAEASAAVGVGRSLTCTGGAGTGVACRRRLAMTGGFNLPGSCPARWGMQPNADEAMAARKRLPQLPGR